MFESVVFVLYECLVFSLGVTSIALPICALLVGTIKFVKGSNRDGFSDYVSMIAMLLVLEMGLCLFFLIGYSYLYHLN